MSPYQDTYINGKQLGDILAEPGGGLIDLSPFAEAEPGFLDTVAQELPGAISDAFFDPLGLWHASQGGNPSLAGGVLQQSAQQISQGLAEGLKWALILGAGYLIFQSELKRRTTA